MKDTESSSDGSGCFWAALFIVFLILKLTGAVDWSWWIVTLPIWFPIAIIAVFIAFIIISFLIAALFLLLFLVFDR